VLGAATTSPWYVQVPAFVVVGVLQYHMLVLSHEAQHYLIARRRRLNDLIGAWCLAYPFGQPFRSERARHLAHHKLVGHPEDPDFHRYVLEDKRPWLGLIGYFVRLATYGKLLEYLSSASHRSPGGDPEPSLNRRSSSELLTVGLVQLGVLGGFTLFASWAYYPFLWLLPLLVVTTPLSEFREFCEHVSAPGTPLHLKSFRVGVLQRFVIAPVGFSYHAEHHFYPSIPHYRLPEVAADFPESTDSLEVHHSYFDVVRKCRAGRTAPVAPCA
jgi:fatty acid desaturase